MNNIYNNVRSFISILNIMRNPLTPPILSISNFHYPKRLYVGNSNDFVGDTRLGF